MRVFHKRNIAKIVWAALLAGTGIVVGLPKDMPRGPALVSEAFAAEVDAQ